MLRYLLPALIPSWRFFDDVGPSPRIEYCLLPDEQAAPHWQPFRPNAQRIPLTRLLLRLIWNPQRNESLYLLSSSEKLLEQNSTQAQDVIASRIAQALHSGEVPAQPSARLFRFRLLVVTRDNDMLACHEGFVSPAYALSRTWKPLP